MRLAAALFFALCVLPGCGGPTPQQVAVNNAITAKLSVGMTKNEVGMLLGKPKNVEAYGEMEVLLYDEGKPWLTQVALINGKVVAWGDRLYDKTYRSEIVVKYR